jgi:L,D-peptidoglycan transpeptidase YkuD (ErfK/YbiS/YcfS/YnhG family)
VTLRLSKQGLLGFGRCLPCTIGKTGVTTSKREGDGATPAGIMTVEGMYYRPDRLPCPGNWAVPILPGDLWSDASEAPEYNHHVRAPYAPSHETLRRADPLYDLFMITSWNWPNALPGKGSAIFLHQQRRPGYPTEGCIAFKRADLLWLASKVRIGTKIIVPASLA